MSLQTAPSPQRIPYGRQEIEEDDIQAVLEVLRSPNLTQGPRIAEFEAAVARYTGARYAVAVSHGTAALHLACLATGLGPQDTLITSPNTFVASANCGLYTGARVRLCDIDPSALNLDPTALEAILSKEPHAKVIVPVHFAGAVCDMPRIAALAEARKLTVIEDACHALGSTYPSGERVGCGRYAVMTVFSFHPVKAITTGEGGLITTNNPTLYQTLLELRSHGIVKAPARMNPTRAFAGEKTNPWYYEMQSLGFNFRMTDIQAALGLSQLKKLDRFVARRRALVSQYDAQLASIPAIKSVQRDSRERSAHHLYVVRIAFKAKGLTRADVMERLSHAGIGTQVHYIPVHWHPVYEKAGYAQGDFPQSEAYYEEALSLPLYVGLTDEQQTHVVSELKRILT